MENFHPPDAVLLAKLDVSNPQFITQTGLANIWKVVRADGTHVALKAYHNADMRNEDDGVAFLNALDGNGAAKIHHVIDGNVLMEWLDGETLGDLSRSGRDDEAMIRLVETANHIHAKPLTNLPLQRVSSWFENLFSLTIAAGCDAETKRSIQTAQHFARALLNSETDVRCIHGDLHHDNIIATPRGDLAIDAKGAVGERCYELANAMRNPKGADALMRDPDRIRKFVHAVSTGFDVSADRYLKWCIAKCALSIAWRVKGVLETDQDTDLLATLISVWDADFSDQVV